MELTEIPVTKIRRDPSQPRSSFEDEEIEDMAKSMKTTGLINTIEVDPSGMIITGERRWRAAKKAGMSTHAYEEKHKSDPGSAGKAARLGLQLAKMYH